MSEEELKALENRLEHGFDIPAQEGYQLIKEYRKLSGVKKSPDVGDYVDDWHMKSARVVQVDYHKETVTLEGKPGTGHKTVPMEDLKNPRPTGYVWTLPYLLL